jgi:nickel/cobalt tolerance cation efflux system protein
MGTDDMAVVDGAARVHGVQSLRVVDASIMPQVVSGNLNVPTIMMAEKLADEIMAAAEFFINNPDVKHGAIRILFTTDEEIGRGVDKVDLTQLGADFGYTMDGSAAGTIEDESFSADAVEIAINGKTVGQVVSDGTDRTDVVVMLPEDSRNSLDALRAIPIATPAGTMLPLGSLARIDYGLGANVVNREDVSRLIVVSTNVSGRPLGTVVADIQNIIDSKIKLPSGYLIRYGGQFESEQRATANLLLYSLLAMVVIALLMFVAVKSLPATLAILINLPLALVGGLVAILLTGGVLSVGSLIGFITLFGVAVRNGLLLVDNYNRRHAEGMELKEVIRAGSLQRLNAILMTALTSALGTLPLALAFGAGNEILQPLAIVVLGGLITSTILTLLVLPALYARFGGWLLPRLKPVLRET